MAGTNDWGFYGRRDELGHLLDRMLGDNDPLGSNGDWKVSEKIAGEDR